MIPPVVRLMSTCSGPTTSRYGADGKMKLRWDLLLTTVRSGIHRLDMAYSPNGVVSGGGTGCTRVPRIKKVSANDDSTNESLKMRNATVLQFLS